MTVTYDVWIEAAMLPVLLILGIFLIVRFATTTEVNRRFRILTWSTFLCALLAVLSALTLGSGLPRVAILLLRTCYYAAVNANTYCLLRYVIAYVDRYDKRYMTAHRIVLAASFGCLVLNLFYGFFFRISDEGALVRGPLHLLFRACFAFYFLICSYVLECMSYQKYEKRQFATINIVTLALIATFAVQYFIFKDSMVVYAVATVLLFVIFFYIEAPVYRQMRTMQEELEAARKKFELSSARYDAASRAKHDFLANTSHEIRTPMNAILGMNEMIAQEAKDDEETLRASHDIKRAGETLLAIINNILDISKIESGKMEIYPSDFYLPELIEDIEQSARERIEDKGLEFVVKAQEDLPEYLRGDEDALRRITTNLLDNAIKYTEEGTITLHVLGGKPAEEHFAAQEETKASSQPSRIHLQVMVEDTGIGMRTEEMDRLFEMFERVNLKETQSIQGAGLGLTLVWNLTRLMGGTVRAESVYGEGSAFTVDVPMEVVSREAIAADGEYERRKDAPEKTYALNENGAPDFRDKRILIVDDTPVNLVVAKNMLAETGATIDTAMSGEECLDMATAKHYDLIFLDHQMPGMDGLETLRMLRQIGADGDDRENRSKDTPVVALTANAGAAQRDFYRKEGFDDYLAKPMKSAAMMKMTAELIL